MQLGHFLGALTLGIMDLLVANSEKVSVFSMIIMSNFVS